MITRFSPYSTIIFHMLLLLSPGCRHSQPVFSRWDAAINILADPSQTGNKIRYRCAKRTSRRMPFCSLLCLFSATHLRSRNPVVFLEDHGEVLGVFNANRPCDEYSVSLRSNLAFRLMPHWVWGSYVNGSCFRKTPVLKEFTLFSFDLQKNLFYHMIQTNGLE